SSSERGRTDVTSQFFDKKKTIFPKYHIVHSARKEKPARLISPFIVSKALTDSLGPKYKVTKLASGDLLLELVGITQISKLADIETFGDIPVSVTPHRSLNTLRGIISDNDFLHLTEEEMLEGLSEQNVTNVYRIKICKENKEIPTKHLVLTFASCTLPESIQVGYAKISVRPYIPNPRRGFKCQRFGHGSRSCRGRNTCAKCASNDHKSEDCDAAPRCANCEGNHAAYSRLCPVWKNEKEIITIKTKENVTFKEARQRYAMTRSSFSFTAHTNFADVVRGHGAPQRPSAPAQLTLSEVEAGPSAPLADAARAAMPPPQTSPSTSKSAARKASPIREKSTTPLLVGSPRNSSASTEAMDKTRSSPQPQRRRGSLDHKKEKTLITGPQQGGT
ncbi:uncharacterized protein LOC144115177, partial [Amblyomma americanum]